MKKLSIICLYVLSLICVNSQALADDIPDMKDCASIVLRASEGWWLMINQDDSGSYGFGTLPDRVQVTRMTPRKPKKSRFAKDIFILPASSVLHVGGSSADRRAASVVSGRGTQGAEGGRSQGKGRGTKCPPRPNGRQGDGAAAILSDDSR